MSELFDEVCETVKRENEKLLNTDRVAVLEREVKRLREALEEMLKADSAYFNAPADSFDAVIADDRLIRAREAGFAALKPQGTHP